MEFSLVEDKKNWNDFMAGQTHAQFLQSYEWGEFQKKFGRRVWRVGGFENNQLVVAGQVIEHYLGLGQGYFYLPRGPLVLNNQESLKEDLFDFIKEKIANYGTVFVKIEGQTLMPDENKFLFKRVKAVQPANTMLLDLSKTEEELLAKMHQKTRYNIRLASKKNLDLKITDTEKFSDEWKLLKATGKRDKISLHPLKYYHLMNEVLANQEKFIYKKFLVFKDAEALAVGVFMGFGDTFTYVHGASSDKNREVMAPYLLQWEAIKFAKSCGYRYYDFGGVNPVDKNDQEYRPRWEGISRFKYGFGGEFLNCGATFDIIWQPKIYQLLNWLKKMRRWI